MKLLVDEHLAQRLAANLAELFPDTIHVSSAELSSTSDAQGDPAEDRQLNKN